MVRIAVHDASGFEGLKPHTVIGLGKMVLEVAFHDDDEASDVEFVDEKGKTVVVRVKQIKNMRKA